MAFMRAFPDASSLWPSRISPRVRTLLLILCDLALVYAVYRLSFLFRSVSSFGVFTSPMPLSRYSMVKHHIEFLLASHIITFYFFGLYDRFPEWSLRESIRQTFLATLTALGLLVTFYFFRKEFLFPRSIFLVFWGCNWLGTLAFRRVMVRLAFGGVERKRVIIVGATSEARELLQEIERFARGRLEVAGIVLHGDENESGTFEGSPILGVREDLPRLIQEYNVNEVILTAQTDWQDRLIHAITQSEAASARVSVVPSSYEIMIGRISHLRIYELPLLEVVRDPEVPWIRFWKRVSDVTLAALVGIPSLPIFGLAVLLIRWLMPGSIFFRQERVGRDGRPFTIYKLRTMVENAEEQSGPVLASKNDPRVTPLGRMLRKFRIDELPQLWNILRGDMSFVGPRPERPEFVAEYLPTIPGYGERLKVKPGLTGLAQINGGYDTHPATKLKYDLAYIYNHSLWLDLMIFVETLKAILSGRVGY